jgi:hypothetical protein
MRKEIYQMILDILKKIRHNYLPLLVLLMIISSCSEPNDKSIARFYKKGKIISQNEGFLYTTKQGGLNYEIQNKTDSEFIFKTKGIDSISLLILGKTYIAHPFVSTITNRTRNNSDFSYFVTKNDNLIEEEILNSMNTILFISEETDLEYLKSNGDINCKLVSRIGKGSPSWRERHARDLQVRVKNDNRKREV